MVAGSTGLKVFGEGEWKQESGARWRSLAEMATLRLKTLFDAQRQARSFDAEAR
jgi:hypothetical protein